MPSYVGGKLMEEYEDMYEIYKALGRSFNDDVIEEEADTLAKIAKGQFG